jgi:hypothetical protein
MNSTKSHMIRGDHETWDWNMEHLDVGEGSGNDPGWRYGSQIVHVGPGGSRGRTRVLINRFLSMDVIVMHEVPLDSGVNGA